MQRLVVCRDHKVRKEPFDEVTTSEYELATVFKFLSVAVATFMTAPIRIYILYASLYWALVAFAPSSSPIMASAVDSTEKSIDSVKSKILDAESRLSQLIIAAKEELTALHDEKRTLEEERSRVLGEIAAIRRIPAEILREVFLVIFEEDGKGQAGWLFASVCKRWRGLALETPRLWTRIRLVTSLDDENSANIVRLWIERAGPSMLLDIEIYLRVPASRASIPADCAAPMLHSGPGAMAMARRARRRLDDLTGSVPVGNGSESWGHVVVFYLKQQMHRWKRLVFRYDRVFSSLSAFKSISGGFHCNAPCRFLIVSLLKGMLHPNSKSLKSPPSNLP